MSVVERWIPRARIRQDQYGWVDIEAFDSHRVLKVQATTTAHLADRVSKMLSPALAPSVATWVARPGRRALAVGWAKYKSTGRWSPTWREIITQVDGTLAVVELAELS